MSRRRRKRHEEDETGGGGGKGGRGPSSSTGPPSRTSRLAVRAHRFPLCPKRRSSAYRRNRRTRGPTRARACCAQQPWPRSLPRPQPLKR
eukprot:1954511-Pyramimonas_sp.AAC.2